MIMAFPMFDTWIVKINYGFNGNQSAIVHLDRCRICMDVRPQTEVTNTHIHIDKPGIESLKFAKALIQTRSQNNMSSSCQIYFLFYPTGYSLSIFDEYTTEGITR